MKAIVCTKYGPPLEVLQLKEVEKPIPADNQVLVKVHAASVNKKDLAPIRGAWLARLLGTGLRKPKCQIVGDDIAGRVEAVGKNVKHFQPGDEVFGTTDGAFAEYACAREDLLVLKPANMSFEEAAAVPIAAITALQGLRQGQIQPGQKVLVNGASGGVGTFAVQIAKSFETEVTAVCSPRNLEQARAMGADRVIDYTQEDFTQNGQRYDLIIAANGDHSMLAYRRALRPQGICVVIGGSLAQISQALLLGPLLSKLGSQELGFMGIAKLNQPDLAFLKELLVAGKLKPIIDRRYPLRETAEAIRYLEEGHARGKVVITLGD
ncbi:MAG: NAD(P)-dependent alcohol dehydrogenase [Caldilinea sp. CFX5]|nr:NAD(P)-dependent alcohol dehydrogenase [Caldilinea sp. CFX5]